MKPILPPFKSLAGIALISLGTVGASVSHAATLPVDLSLWSVVQYEFNDQPNANWGLSVGNTVATQSVNADASILLSDFSVGELLINGKWRVDTSSDNDYMGFVFGYQGRGEYYLFDWKQSDQNYYAGFAERGMSLKVVEIPAGGDPTATDLWPSAGSANVDVLRHNTIAWDEFIEYEFSLNFSGAGAFSITVKEGANVLEHWVVNDNTYLSGSFGFYNYSQGDVVYTGFTTRDDPPPVIPETSTVISAISLALVGAGTWFARRSRRS